MRDGRHGARDLAILLAPERATLPLSASAYKDAVHGVDFADGGTVYFRLQPVNMYAPFPHVAPA